MEPLNYTVVATVKGHTVIIQDSREIISNDHFAAIIIGPEYNGEIIFKRQKLIVHNYWFVGDKFIANFQTYIKHSDPTYLWNFRVEISMEGSPNEYIRHVFEHMSEIVTKGVHDG